MKKSIFLFLSILYFQVSFSQTVKLYSKSNSKIPENELWSIAVDKTGNKWIGTSNFGLLKYDGKIFHSFNKTNSPIKGSFISPIFVDSNGNVWINYSRP